MDKVLKKDEIFPCLSHNIQERLSFIPNDKWDLINELRITVNSPVMVDLCGKRSFVADNKLSLNIDECYLATTKDISTIMELVTRSSVYAYNRYINNGFITLSGANRIGICGNCVVNNGEIVSVKEINSLNIRLSHDKKGVSEILFNDILVQGQILNTLFISPPGAGKTTFLRDLALMLNDVKKCNRVYVCAIIDERYELACAQSSIPCFDIGKSNFVISGYDKSKAIPLVVRSMSPDCIITDELWCEDDYRAIEFALRSGCSVIASVHGLDENINEVIGINFKKLFKKYVVLSKRRGPGTIEKIMDVL